MLSLLFGYHIIADGKAFNNHYLEGKPMSWITRQIPDIFQGPLTKIFGIAVAITALSQVRPPLHTVCYIILQCLVITLRHYGSIMVELERVGGPRCPPGAVSGAGW